MTFDALLANLGHAQSCKSVSCWSPNPARARNNKPELVPIPTFIFEARFSLQFTQCKQEAANSLPALKPWHYLSIRLSHLQTSQST